MNLSPAPTLPRRWIRLLLLAGALVAVLAGAWWAYHPGLTGGFQFDDFGNLPVLGATGPVDNWATFWRYITSGDADPTGRPIALLSFLIDARNWPASPRPFLVTSVELELVNGVLLFLLLRQLGRAFSIRPADTSEASQRLTWRVNLAAVLGAALWLLHPLFVSTTLYIVQREAMLAATFVMVGLLLWLHGRARMLAGHTTSGWLWMLLGLGGCTLLAVLSKANGVLLPALALTIEYTVLRHRNTGAGHDVKVPNHVIPAKAGIHWGFAARLKMDSGLRRDNGGARAGNEALSAAMDFGLRRDDGGAWAGNEALSAASRDDAESVTRQYRWALALLAWLPACVVAAYLLHVGWDGFMHGTGNRPWTLGQRLLTEPRVLMNYWQLLWLPRPFTPGLFNDQLDASMSILQPWTTLPCILAVVGLIVAAIWLRKRWPTLALAVLFYFVGQALESSTVALELYFEHRNYLPAILMFWPLALWLCGVRQTHRSAAVSGKADKPGGWQLTAGKGIVAVLLLAGLGLMTHARASVWGNTHEQALLWARLNPGSPRAQANAAMAELHAGQPLLAARHLRGLLKQKPSQVQLALNLFAAECRMGYVSPSTLQAAKAALSTTRNPGALLAHWFGHAIGQASHPMCPQLTLATIEQLLAAARSNPRLMAIKGRRQDLLYLQGFIALKRRQPKQALADFKQSLNQDVRATAAFKQAAVLGSQGYPQRGLALLHYYETDARQHTAIPAFGMPRVHVWVLHREHYWQYQLKHLRHALQEAARGRA